MAFALPILAAVGASGGAALAGGTAATALGIGSSALGMFSTLQQGFYQAKVASNNAAIAERNAELRSEASQKEQARSDKEYAQLLGEQTAIQGASGLDILGRSATRARMLTRRVRADQARDIRLQGDADVRGLKQEAANFRAEAKAAKTQAITSALGQGLELGQNFASGKYKLGSGSSLVGGARSTRVRNRFPFD